VVPLFKIIISLSCALFITFDSIAAIKHVETVFKREQQDEFSKLLKVHFIDIGGGDAILINTPSNKKILIDGGFSWQERKLASIEYKTYLDEYLADDIVDIMVITHPDYDHFGGFAEVLQYSTVKQVWASGYDSDELSGSWRTLLKKLEKAPDTLFLSPLSSYLGLGSVIRIDDAGTINKDDDITITIINAPKRIPKKAYGNSGRTLDESQRRNSSSIVLRLDFGETSFLFTGDTNGRKKKSGINNHDDQEKFMVDNNNNPNHPIHGLLNVDVLKVAHHGSDGSSSLKFLQTVKPQWAVITAGKPHGHPHSGVLERLEHQSVGLSKDNVIRTDNKDSGKTTEKNLGDDTIVFTVDKIGVVDIKVYNIDLN